MRKPMLVVSAILLTSQIACASDWIEDDAVPPQSTLTRRPAQFQSAEPSLAEAEYLARQREIEALKQQTYMEALKLQRMRQEEETIKKQRSQAFVNDLSAKVLYPLLGGMTGDVESARLDSLRITDPEAYGRAMEARQMRPQVNNYFEAPRRTYGNWEPYRAPYSEYKLRRIPNGYVIEGY